MVSYGNPFVQRNGPNFDFAIVSSDVRDIVPVTLDRPQIERLAGILRTRAMRPGENVKLGGVVVKRTSEGYGLWFPNIRRVLIDFESAQRVAREIEDCLAA